MDVKLEVVVVPVSDLDRAKEFYETAGFGWTSTTSAVRTSEWQESGPDPERNDYGSFATFSDPDGNAWMLQEVKTRAPGR